MVGGKYLAGGENPHYGFIASHGVKRQDRASQSLTRLNSSGVPDVIIMSSLTMKNPLTGQVIGLVE